MKRYLNSATLLAVSVTAAIVLFMLLLSQCDARKRQSAQSKVDAGQAEASIASGQTAINTVESINQNAAQEDAVAEEGINAIRQATPEHRADATVAAACRLRAYRDTDRCAKLRQANPAKP